MDNLVVNPRIASCRMGESLYLVNVYGHMFELNTLAKMIWESFSVRIDIENIKNRVHEEFSTIDRDIISGDIDELLNEFLERKLVLTSQEVKKEGPGIEKQSYKVPTSDNAFWQMADRYKTPAKVDIEIIGSCNQQCVYCYLDDTIDFQSNQPIAVLDLQTIDSLLTELKELGTLYITLTGGEPFMHPEIFPIISSALDKKFYVRVLTNGTLLDENNVKKLSDLQKKGLLSLDITLHSFNFAKHDKFTQSPGSFEKTMKGINLCIENNVCFAIQFNMTKINRDELPKAKLFSIENNINLNVGYTLLPGINHIFDGRALQLSNNTLRSLIETRDFQPKKMYCSAGKTKCWIDFHGDVHFCELLRSNSGNIKNCDFYVIWDAIVDTYEENFPEVCKGCRMDAFCPKCQGELFLNKDAINYYCEIASHSKTVHEGGAI